MKHTNDIMLVIKPENPKTKWVALDSHDKIISEGDSPVSVSEDAKKKTKDFSLLFIPAAGNTYIF